jgi:hypothetical protein
MPKLNNILNSFLYKKTRYMPKVFAYQIPENEREGQRERQRERDKVRDIEREGE